MSEQPIPGVPNIINSRTLAVTTFVCLTGAQDQEWVARVARLAGPDFWLVVAAAWAVGVALTWLVARAATARPDAEPRRPLPQALGWAGVPLQALFALYLVLEAARFLRVGSSVVHFVVLPRTPTWALALMGVGPPLLLLGGGLASVLSFGSTLLWPLVATALVLYFGGVRESDWGNLLPVLTQAFSPLLHAAAGMLEPVLGAELLLVLAPAALQSGTSRRHVVRGAVIGAMGRGLFYALDGVLLQAAFGPFELIHLKWPLIELTRHRYLPALLRLDLIWLIVVLMATMAAVTLYTWTAWCLCQGIGLSGETWEAVLMLIGVAAMTSCFPSLPGVEALWLTWVAPVGLLFSTAVPLFLLASAWRRRRVRP